MNEALKASAMTLLRYACITAATSLATHGVIASNHTEAAVSVLVAIGIAGWGVWDKYVKVILIAQLEIWKARSQAQSAALKNAMVPEPTAATIADKIPDPRVTATTVAKTVAAGCIMLLAIGLCGTAHAQSDANTRGTGARPLGPIGQRIQERAGGDDEATQVFDDIRKATLADVEYASKLAKAQKPPDDLAATCWDAWADRLRAEQDANLGPEPDPHLVTALQRAMNVRNSLQPESPFMRACTPLVAKLKTDIRKFIGLAITGGAGLGKLLPGLP